MPESRELDLCDCERLLRASVVGRVALSTPDGPHIIPVSHVVVEDTIVVCTSPYSILGTYGPDTMLAFEIDHVDHDRHVGWSVLARGRAWAEVDPVEVARIREVWQPRPWAAGNRNLYLRIRWSTLTGRVLGTHWDRHDESPLHRTLTAL